MTSTTPDITRLELAAALNSVAKVLQARINYSDGRALLDRRVLLQVAAGLPNTARFDRHVWEKAWRASRHDGTGPHRRALYKQMCQTLADELEDEAGRWEGRHEPAVIRRLASRLRSVDTRVCIDDTLGPLDAKVDPQDRWNGWLSPRFTLDAVRELAAQTQRLAEECGAESVDTVHVIHCGGKDADGNPLAVVLRVTWMYLAEEGARQSTLIIEPDDEGRYNVGACEWTWHFASWWCLCIDPGQDWHVLHCEDCGMTREQALALKDTTRRVGQTLRRLAPGATAALFEADGAPRIVGVFAGDTELTLGDGGPFDTETLGEVDAVLLAGLGRDLTDIGPHWLRFPNPPAN
ncbi:hypothetical protein [Streptomyces sp. DH12]|uniref:hypothetical protein n=1 Tax=Streptomyces sp. DH12 TaxID=2857010 RepID=UPI001E33AA03|nr:hypothetical protein [Streptomyces sp. DH12]